MPFKEQPMDVAYQPPMYEHPDYDRDAEVTPLTGGGYVVWQDPDRMEVYDSRAAFFKAREMAAAEVPAQAARDLLRHQFAGDSETYTVAGAELTRTIRGWYE